MADDAYDDLVHMARSALGGHEERAELHEANEWVNAALRLRPKSCEAWILKAHVLAALDDTWGALAAADAAVRLGTRRAEAHYVRAVMLADLARADEALAALERAFANLERRNGRPPARKGVLPAPAQGSSEAEAEQEPDEAWLREDLYCEKAALLEAAGRSAEAEQAFEEGLRACPDSEVLRAGLEPLRKARVRGTLRVIPGGRT